LPGIFSSPVDFSIGLFFGALRLIRVSSHPESFAVRDTQRLAAMGTKVDIAFAEYTAQRPAPDRLQPHFAMWTDRLFFLFFNTLDHNCSSFLNEWSARSSVRSASIARKLLAAAFQHQPRFSFQTLPWNRTPLHGFSRLHSSYTLIS